MFFIVLCIIMCCLQSTLSSAPSERKESILLPPILRLRRIQPVINHLQLPPEANEINTFQLPGASSQTHERVTNSPRRSLGTSPTSTLHSNYVLIQTGFLCSSVRNCENIFIAETCSLWKNHIFFTSGFYKKKSTGRDVENTPLETSTETTYLPHVWR